MRLPDVSLTDPLTSPAVLRAAGPGSRAQAVRVNAGLQLPIVLVSVYLADEIGMTGMSLDVLRGLLKEVLGWWCPWVAMGDWKVGAAERVE